MEASDGAPGQGLLVAPDLGATNKAQRQRPCRDSDLAECWLVGGNVPLQRCRPEDRVGMSARPYSTGTMAGTALLVPAPVPPTSPQPPFSSSLLHSPFAAYFTDNEKQSLAHPPPMSLHVMALHQPRSLSCTYHSVCFLASLPVFLFLHLCHTLSLPHFRQSSLRLYFLGSLCFPLLSFSLVFSCCSFSLSLLNSVYHAISPLLCSSRCLSPPVLSLSSLHNSLSPSLYSLVSLSLPLFPSQIRKGTGELQSSKSPCLGVLYPMQG